ncbi:unnamed protein product [Linum trigynum]|uniref:Uncharacterized protein n=1 Tax=Linum trigynum TaxID=586398 RepID=A0AAV2E840_9ROSI
MKRTTRSLKRGGRRAIRGRARGLENAAAMMNLDVYVEVRVNPGVGKGINEAGETERMQVYPPKRPGVFAIRHWPPNCGLRRDGRVTTGDGGALLAATSWELLPGEEEEEP